MKQLSLHLSAKTAPVVSVDRWPFAPSAPFARSLSRLLMATRGLPLAGWEAACRLSPSGVTCNRLLLGLDTAVVAPHRLQALAQTLEMPPDLAQPFAQELPQAVRILLAAEQDARGVELKAYLEFDPAEPGAGDLPPGLAIRGRKWRDPLPGFTRRCTDYWRTGAQPADLVPWLQERHGSLDALVPATGLLAQVLALAQASAHRAPDCLIVTESPSQRLSCCVRLYDSGLQLQALQAGLQRLAQAWQLPSTELAHLPAQRRLGWLATGLDACGDPFLTLYGESSLADARHAIALGAFDEKR